MTAPKETILKVDDVWRSYGKNSIVGQKRASQIVWRSLLGLKPKPSDTKMNGIVNVTKGISFELKRGEALGIIGLNGAGKTTLLRLLAGQLMPDRGEITVTGQTGTLIDLTSGIKDGMSGVDNIFLRSAMLGRPRKEIEDKIEEIIAFTELGSAIYSPVAGYSSGMRMRLAFASTVFMNPDLFLVDEVLSVGDFKFRQKCLERIRMLREKSAFVLVTHSMSDVSRFCDKVIVLEKGKIAFSGEPDEAVSFYYEKKEQAASKQKEVAKRYGPLGEFIHNSDSITDVDAQWVDENDNPVEKIRCGEVLELRIRFKTLIPTKRIIIGIPMFGNHDDMLTAFSSDQMGIKIDAEPNKVCEVRIRAENFPLSPGHYNSVIAIHDGPGYLYRQQLPSVEVQRGELPKYWGDFVLPQDWKVT